MAAKTKKSPRARLRAGTYDQAEVDAAKAAKSPAGRPRTDLSALPRNWKTRMLKLAREGHGVTAILCHLHITKRVLDTLIEDHVEFRDTYTEAMRLYQLWWETLGNKLANGKNKHGNGAVWAFNMKNRFSWRDKTELTGDPEKPVGVQSAPPTKEQLRQELIARGLPTTLLKDDEE